MCMCVYIYVYMYIHVHIPRAICADPANFLQARVGSAFRAVYTCYSRFLILKIAQCFKPHMQHILVYVHTAKSVHIRAIIRTRVVHIQQRVTRDFTTNVFQILNFLNYDFYTDSGGSI
jgi:hypothetical protein